MFSQPLVPCLALRKLSISVEWKDDRKGEKKERNVVSKEKKKSERNLTSGKIRRNLFIYLFIFQEAI